MDTKVLIGFVERARRERTINYTEMARAFLAAHPYDAQGPTFDEHDFVLLLNAVGDCARAAFRPDIVPGLLAD